MLALGIIFAIVSFVPHSAYGHGCHSSDCLPPWPTGILSSYSDVAGIISLAGAGLTVAMLAFKFEYLQHRDFYTTRYHPVTDRINHLLFSGRDKRKIVAAIPFLIFGGYLASAGLYSLITFDNLRNVDFAVMFAVITLPFLTAGAFLMVCGLKEISFVTLKKEPMSA